MAGKHRQRISEGQLALLKLLYKYRYGSVELLRESLGLRPGPGVYKKLVILSDEGYIARRYDSSYRIKGLPAAYYLLPKGYRELQKLPEYRSIDDRTIKSAYKDKTASPAFITHSLTIYSVSCQLQRLYPALKFFTKREIADYRQFPSARPDGFLSLKVGSNDRPHRFFLDVIPDSTPRYAIDKKLQSYFDFFEEGGWDATNSPLPAILLLSESGRAEKRLQAIAARKLQSFDLDGLSCFTSTIGSLTSIAVWSSVNEPDELCSLDAIS